VASSLYHDPRLVLRALLAQSKPVIHVEHKLLYPLHLLLPLDGRIDEDIADEHLGQAGLPTTSIRPVERDGCVLTVVAYGYQAELARRAASRLAMEEELFVELVVPSQISPLDWTPIDASVRKTRRVLVIEEGVIGWSWGSDVAAQLSERFFGHLQRPVSIVASEPSVIPSSRELETAVLPTEEKIREAIKRAAG
jgi:acetoin:2,6-dichlorophenolindophenol oxidoreductase subunit beta